MLRRLALTCALALLFAPGISPLFAADPETARATQATGYMLSLQNSDGGFPDFTSASGVTGTFEAVFALASAGTDARTVTDGGNAPDDYLATKALQLSGEAGDTAKLVAALAAMDLDPSSFASLDLLATMDGYYNAGTGQYGFDAFAQSLFILANRALDRPIPPAAVTYLRGLQKLDGAWEYCCNFGTDTNTTSIALRALIAAGVAPADADVQQALTYLHGQQAANGGFPYSTPFDADPNSTAYVIQAIVAVGEDPGAGGAWDLGGGNHPLGALVSFQNTGNGAMQYFGSDNALATYQGIPGLLLVPFPERLNLNADGDACTDLEELGGDHVNGGQRDPDNSWDFFDTTGEGAIDLGDTIDVLGYFGDPAQPSTPGDLRDRAVLAPMTEPWRTSEANDGVDLTDAINSLASFGDDCSGVPN